MISFAQDEIFISCIRSNYDNTETESVVGLDKGLAEFDLYRLAYRI